MYSIYIDSIPNKVVYKKIKNKFEWDWDLFYLSFSKREKYYKNTKKYNQTKGRQKREMKKKKTKKQNKESLSVNLFSAAWASFTFVCSFVINFFFTF